MTILAEASKMGYFAAAVTKHLYVSISLYHTYIAKEQKFQNIFTQKS